MRLKRLFLGVMLLVGITGAGATNAAPEDISASISLKVPGNEAKQYPLALQKMQDGMYSCRASGIAATCVRRRRLLLSTHRTVGWCVRTV